MDRGESSGSCCASVGDGADMKAGKKGRWGTGRMMGGDESAMVIDYLVSG